MHRSIGALIACVGLLQDTAGSQPDKEKLHADLAAAAVSAGDQLIKIKAWDETRAFLELIRAKSDAGAEALDKLIAKTEKQTSGLKWDAKSSELIKAFGSEQAKKFFAFARTWKEKDPEASRWTHAEGEILDDLLDYVKAYALLTKMRSRYALPKTLFDWKLSVPAFWHAEYKRLNPTDGREVEGNAGYSHEGRQSGQHSITSRGESLTEHINGILHGPFHRSMILNPSLHSTGFGQSTGPRPGSVINVYGGLVHRPAVEPLAVPCNEETGVPPSGFDANLEVIKGKSLRDLGYPLTLIFFEGSAQPTHVTAKLYESLKEIDCYVSSPKDPAMPMRYPNNRNTILLIPKARLRDQTQYKVKITFSLDDQSKVREWTFKTGH